MLALLATLTVSGCGRRADVGPVVVSVIGTRPHVAGTGREALPEGDRLLTDAVAEGLVRFDAGGQVEGGAAERWTVIDGGMSYIFRLHAAEWGNGTALRAPAVVALLKRQLASAADNRLRPYLSAITAVTAMTPEVVEVELARPRPDLLKLFAQPELALVDGRARLGLGPFRLRGEQGGMLHLVPALDPLRDPEENPVTAEDEVLLAGETAARAVARFVGKGSDLVAGGTIDDWPIVQAGRPAPVNLRLDPAEGLFGLAVARRAGFLADAADRAAVAGAIDRATLTALVSPEWPARETLLPDRLDSAAAPVVPVWSALAPDARRAAARARVAAYRARTGAAPTLAIALPAGLGGTLLWQRLALDLLAVGIRPVRSAPGATDADLRLIDLVAPYDSARWYLAEACVACSDEASRAIEAARLAPTLGERATAIATADTALTADAAFIPLARPLRWSLVAGRLTQWQPNARAFHPLNHLRGDTR